MAMEVRVYPELTQIRPKVIGGLTWRQLGACLIILVTSAAIIAGMWFTGHRTGFATMIIAPNVPVILWAFWRPHKLAFEVWLRHAIGFYQRPMMRVYINQNSNPDPRPNRRGRHVLPPPL